MVEGTHSLAHTQGLLDVFELEEPYRLMGRNMHRLLNGLGWKPLVDMSDEADFETYTSRLLNDLFGEACVEGTDKQGKGSLCIDEC
jgi:hypothetical protein